MNGLASSVPAVRVEGVVKRFGATVALDGAGLEVPAGMVFGLLGPNGAGKTTLVRILATLLAPDAGRAEVFGHDVVREAAAVRELIGLTGQFAAIDELLTGRENLEMFGRLFNLSRKDAHRRAGELLDRFDLAPAAGRPARTYSGGMRRRLDIASSLLTRPRVLFLDEPTTGLDPRSRNEIWAIVRELRREGTTLLLTTQYLEEADQLADRIAVIDRGKVIAEGTGNELKDRVGGQLLEVELSSAGQRDRAQAVLGGGGLRRSSAGRAPGPAHPPGPAQRAPAGGGGGRRAAPGTDRRQRHRAAPAHAGRCLPAADRRPAQRGRRRTEPPDPAPPPAPAAGAERASASQAGPAAAAPVPAVRSLGNHRHRRGHRPQPASLHPPARPADLLHHPAGPVRAAVRLRVRRRGRPLAAARGRLRRLPAARDLRPVGHLRRLADGGRPVGRPATRGGRPVPVHADGPLGRAGRAHRGGPGPQHPHHRPDDRRRLPGRVPLPRRGSRSGRGIDRGSKGPTRRRNMPWR